MQIAVMGFLGKNAVRLTTELWDMLLDAQNNGEGIPTVLLESKKAELKKRMVHFVKNSFLSFLDIFSSILCFLLNFFLGHSRTLHDEFIN